jgi:hypothetical protein
LSYTIVLRRKNILLQRRLTIDFPHDINELSSKQLRKFTVSQAHFEV